MQLPYRFDKYLLIRKIAVGGMAEIFRAKYIGEGGFEKTVAVKRLLPAWSSDKNFTAMLIDEAKVLVHLQHPNVVQVIELGKDSDSYFISMELIEGIDLGQLYLHIIRDQIPLPKKFCIYIITQILNALDFAHKQTGPGGKLLNIVHRDISPPNVLLSWNGEVRVADFGIAKGAHRTYETQAAQAKGKYSYMSPEQARGEAVDCRTDIYAAGIILYELVTSSHLYDAPNDLEVIELVKKSSIPLDSLNKIVDELKRIIIKALHKEPSKRYQKADEFLTDLNNYALSIGQLVNPPEFGAFLKNSFPKKIAENEDERKVSEDIYKKTKILGNEENIRTPLKKKGKRKIVIVSAAIIFFAIIITVYTNLRGGILSHLEGRLGDGFGSRLVTEQNNFTPPPPAVSESSTQEEGFINIQAKPWGYATINGYLSKKETPIKKLKLKEGKHTVKVYNEPMNKWLISEITVNNGETVNCTAKFGPASSILCK